MASETITLSAESKFGHSGQYIAKLVGRAERVQFDRVFVGAKFGKRSECTSYETDEAGLYEVCDVGKRGKDKTYYLVLPWHEGLIKLTSDSADALKIAKRLGAGERLEQIARACLGDPLTDSQWYVTCSVCGAELTDGQPCAEHASEGYRVNKSRLVPRLKADGSPVRAIVYEILTPAQARKQEASGTLDAAVDSIVAVLASLPAPAQRKALTLVRAKLFPKAEEVPENQNDDSQD